MLGTCPHSTGSLRKPLPKTLRPKSMPSGGIAISGMNAWAAAVTASSLAFHILGRGNWPLRPCKVQG